ncbi:MAG: hypothetical protein LBN93_11905 [Candidatus Symbiothrix sp.]|jgi:hypothetical protein|nr:hypothetical protein [Candidatus Symbiothrix sp.]
MAEYDDEIAVKFIQNQLPAELKEKFNDDDIYYILDVVCEFYEKRDWLSDDDDEKEAAELVKFVIKQAAKDGIGVFSDDEIRLVLAAEDAYAETLDS